MQQDTSLPELRAPWARVSCVLLLLMVTWCLLTPNPPGDLHTIEIRALRGDLLIHLSVFTMVSFFIICLRPAQQLATGFKASACFAIITEILQIPVPNRTCDPFDMLANFLGVFCGLFLALSYWRLIRVLGRDFLRRRFSTFLLPLLGFSRRMYTSSPTNE
ncbi:MAG: hypothetical protein CMJ46_01240 [Planctomyces sp.]|nr:hypothetical protein [Planctomyces sp.]